MGYGSFLGAYRENDIIAWDTDGDIGIFDFVLDTLPVQYETKTFVFRRNPILSHLIYDSHNTVSARFISKTNGVFIDIFAYSIVEDAIKKEKYRYNKWSLN